MGQERDRGPPFDSGTHSLSFRGPCAKRDGIARGFRRRDVVLPAPACLSAHKVHRPSFNIERPAVRVPAFLRWIRPQEHAAVATERDSDNHLEVRNIAVPTQLSGGAVLCDKRVHELYGRNSRPTRDTFPQRMQELGNRTCGKKFTTREVIAAAIAYNAPFRGVDPVFCFG
jgi:hypothetical protein